MVYRDSFVFSGVTKPIFGSMLAGVAEFIIKEALVVFGRKKHVLLPNPKFAVIQNYASPEINLFTSHIDMIYLIMDKETCFRCGEEVWVNSLGYCKKCMQEMIDQHHAENKKEEILLLFFSLLTGAISSAFFTSIGFSVSTLVTLI